MPRKRRQRYTVTTTTSKVVVLAYSEQGARSVALFNGLTPTGIAKGDYRLSGNPKKGWTLDEAALRRAQSLLGLRWPVIVATNSREGSTLGNYHLRCGTSAPKRLSWLWIESYYHRIMLKSYLTPQDANESLWHELIHAKQAENAGSVQAWLGWHNQQRQNWNYNDRPMEIEAREGAKKFSGMVLTKPL